MPTDEIEGGGTAEPTDITKSPDGGPLSSRAESTSLTEEGGGMEGGAGVAGKGDWDEEGLDRGSADAGGKETRGRLVRCRRGEGGRGQSACL